jgi:hypothetical protein
MKVEVTHSVVQDMSVVKFFSLGDYRRCIAFLHKAKLEWIPLKYSGAKDTASIRVGEHVLNIITDKFGVNKDANTNTNGGTSGVR